MKVKIIVFLLFLIGGLLSIVGLWGVYRLYDQSNQTIHTIGVVTHLTTEKRYIRGKQRFKSTARIQYETERYTTHVNMQLYNPFILQGSKISLWYYPHHTEKVVIPSEQGILWGGTCGVGALFLLLGIACITTKKQK